MSYRDKEKNTPRAKPVIKIELSEEHKTLRWIIVVLLLAIGVTAIGAGLFKLLSVEPGWKIIEVSSDTINCSSDFALNYHLGTGELSATEEQRQIHKVYEKATVDAYRIFSDDVLEEGLHNVAYLNQHINETVQVDEALYEALETVVAYDNRNVFLAPVYVEYDHVFFASSEVEAAQYDPSQNPELMAYISPIAAFASDPEMIRLELKGGNQVCLTVSEEYLTFAEEHEIDRFFDFGWMANAFIVDFLADSLIEAGFTNGYLASYDGFTRNLDDSGTVYSFNIFNRDGNQIDLPAVMNYSGATSIVYLRDYPMSESDQWHYYSFEESQTILTSFIDPTDGVSKSATHNIVSYSHDMGCAEILMQVAPVFITDKFDSSSLKVLTGEGIESIWCNGKKVLYTQQDLVLNLSADTGYHGVHVK
ncbi:MAG: hypothetical protein IJX69_01215 [Oscillospiraceae bacterium]|nr:hypothetical protein [Oscillospiraceae bacterium]